MNVHRPFRRLAMLIAAAALSAGPASAQNRPAEICDRYAARSGSTVAACAVNLLTGETLLLRREHTPMLPASVQKIVTSAVALEILGADFEFVTTLARHDAGLLVVGDGDPTFGDPVLAEQRGGTIYDTLDAWADALAGAGVESVDGIVLDETIFDAGRHDDWPRSQRHRWYCAPSAGLNFNNNCLDVTLRNVDGRIVADIEPRTRWMSIVSAVRPGRRDIWSLALSDQDASARLRGQLHGTMHEPLSVAVNEPALLLGRVLAERLAMAGVEVAGPIARTPGEGPIGQGAPRLDDATVVAEHRTPLPTVLDQANKRSLNMMAECLLLRSAAAEDGGATWNRAAATASRTLTERYGLAPDSFTVADGSGMSRRNRITAAAIVRLLDQLGRGTEALPFLQSLSVCGVDGTLDDRLTDHPGRFIGKTGTLSGVVTLAGYVLNHERRPTIALAVLCNNVRTGHGQARTMMDEMIRAWIDQLDAEATTRPGEPTAGN